MKKKTSLAPFVIGGGLLLLLLFPLGFSSSLRQSALSFLIPIKTLFHTDRADEIARLKAKIQELEAEKVLLLSRPAAASGVVSAQVIFRTHAAWQSFLWLDKGALDVPFPLMNAPVTKGEVLIGVIEEVRPHAAKVRLITDANLKDLVRKIRTTMVKGRGSKYRPDIVIMNSDTFDQYYLKKDSQNRYIFDDTTGTLAGMSVVEDNFIPDNQLIVGDRRFAAIYQMGGIVLSEAQPNAQFLEDMKTLKARKRMLMLIREVDRTGFLLCTDIAAALTTLEEALPT